MNGDREIPTTQAPGDPAGPTLNYSSSGAAERRHSKLGLGALAMAFVAPATFGVLLVLFVTQVAEPRALWRYVFSAGLLGGPAVSLGLAVAGLVVPRRRRWPAGVALGISAGMLAMYGVFLALQRG